MTQYPKHERGGHTDTESVDLGVGQKMAESSHIPPSDLMKSWLQKLLVIVLCGLSFFAGWHAHHSKLIRQCLNSGGEVSTTDEVFHCQ